MKIGVELAGLARLGGVECIDEPRQHVLDLRQRLRRDPLRRDPGEMRFEHEPDVVQQLRLIRREPIGDKRAAAPVGDHQPFALQHPQTLAHRCPADPGPLHHHRLGQPRPRRLAPHEDVLADHAAHVLCQRRRPLGRNVGGVGMTTESVPIRSPRHTAF